jgi:hypothetical protein
MDTKDALMIALMFMVFGVPALGITARFALKPIVDSIVRLREAFNVGPASGVVERRVLELEDEVAQLRSSVTGLEETVAFQQKLLAGPTAASPAIAAPAPEQ